MWYRRNPITWITRAYYDLLPVVPTYREALNICLVLGGLRQATSVLPDRDAQGEMKYPDYETLHRTLLNICRKKKQIGITGFTGFRGHKCTLVFDPDIGIKVDEWGGDLNNHKLYGEILGYICAGDIELKDKFFYSLVSINPDSGNVNPFFSQACREVSPDLIAHFDHYGREVKDFLENNEIADSVGFDIQDKKGNVLYEEWF